MKIMSKQYYISYQKCRIKPDTIEMLVNLLAVFNLLAMSVITDECSSYTVIILL